VARGKCNSKPPGKATMERWRAILENQRSVARIMAPNDLVLAAFDESGKLSDTQFVVFGGSVATPASWEVICEKWNETIKPKGIPCLSMKEAMHFHGPFATWAGRHKERDALLLRLAEMAQPLIAFHISTPMASAHFRSLPNAIRRSLKNPQYCGFEGCMRSVINAVKNPNMRVSLCCDSTDEFSVECLKLYLEIRRREPVLKAKCVSIIFAEDEHYPPLQLADMVAYCIRQDYTRQTVQPEPIIDALLAIFRRDGSIPSSFGYDVDAKLGLGTLGE
jgi:hypothetical protein